MSVKQKSKIKKKGQANNVDEYVGLQLKQRRIYMGFSQEHIASILGISFQQLQKYEKGSNRISASKLYNLSVILKVSVSFFFEACPLEMDEVKTQPSKNATDPLKEKNVLKMKETLDLVRIYYSIKNKNSRKMLFNLVCNLSKELKEQEKI